MRWLLVVALVTSCSKQREKNHAGPAASTTDHVRGATGQRDRLRR
jgi:hypothetical protein